MNATCKKDVENEIKEIEYRVMKNKNLLKMLKEKELKKNNDGHVVKEKMSHFDKLDPKMKKYQMIISKKTTELMEGGKAQGFVYVIFPQNSPPIIHASENLQDWWNDKIRFCQKGYSTVDKHKNGNVSGTSSEMGLAKICPLSLYKIRDPTLGSILSRLMIKCRPSHRSFPLKDGISPPWWPTGQEDWWPQLGLPEDMGPPPYKKPHHLNKLWKVGVLTAVIKHMMPCAEEIMQYVKESRQLQNCLTVHELNILAAMIEHELYLYRQHQPEFIPDVSTSQGNNPTTNVPGCHEDNDKISNNGRSSEMIPDLKRKAVWIETEQNKTYTCAHSEFPNSYRDMDFHNQNVQESNQFNRKPANRELFSLENNSMIESTDVSRKSPMVFCDMDGPPVNPSVNLSGFSIPTQPYQCRQLSCSDAVRMAEIQMHNNASQQFSLQNGRGLSTTISSIENHLNDSIIDDLSSSREDARVNHVDSLSHYGFPDQQNNYSSGSVPQNNNFADFEKNKSIRFQNSPNNDPFLLATVSSSGRCPIDSNVETMVVSTVSLSNSANAAQLSLDNKSYIPATVDSSERDSPGVNTAEIFSGTGLLPTAGYIISDFCFYDNGMGKLGDLTNFGTDDLQSNWYY